MEQLVAHGLGSCVAVCLFDPVDRVGGLAHVVLPGTDPAGRPNARFAGSALPALLQALSAVGGAADAWRYQARLVGGARVLHIGENNGQPRIGDQNVKAMHAVLRHAGVIVVGEAVGGGQGRTVWFDPRDGGRVKVRGVDGEVSSF